MSFEVLRMSFEVLNPTLPLENMSYRPELWRKREVVMLFEVL
jgi:hypothetical protein